MDKKRLVAASLLLATLADVALADDNKTGTSLMQPQTKKVRKVEVILNSLGINSAEVRQFIDAVDERVEGGYLNLAEDRIAGGRIVLHFQLGGGVTAKQLELKYTPDNSNWEATARTNAVMVNYRLQF